MVDVSGCPAKPGVLDCAVMELRHAIMGAPMGRQVDRFHEYQPQHTLAERVEKVKLVRGAEGVETAYAQDFADPERTVALVRDSGLPVFALNLDVESEKKWQRGSFTASDPELRANAVANLKSAMDLAAELDA